jgi:hypothetical protein
LSCSCKHFERVRTTVSLLQNNADAAMSITLSHRASIWRCLDPPERALGNGGVRPSEDSVEQLRSILRQKTFVSPLRAAGLTSVNEAHWAVFDTVKFSLDSPFFPACRTFQPGTAHAHGGGDLRRDQAPPCSEGRGCVLMSALPPQVWPSWWSSSSNGKGIGARPGLGPRRAPVVSECGSSRPASTRRA